MRGQIPGKSLGQKQIQGPPAAPRAVMAQPNQKGLVTMPVRQRAIPPAQFVPKIPGARMETRLTIR
jgi:hypothetical protein